MVADQLAIAVEGEAEQAGGAATSMKMNKSEEEKKGINTEHIRRVQDRLTEK